MNEENPFKKMKEDNTKKELPEGVMERLKKHSERTGESLSVVKEGFFDYIKTNYSVEDWHDEDEDLLVDWAEQFATKLRSSTVSGGINTETFVGQFVGIAPRTGDRRKGLAGWMVRQYKEDPNAFVSSGRGGVYEKQDGQWIINSANGLIETSEMISEVPSMGIPAGNNQYICFVSKKGNPYPPTLTGRYAYFLGNEQKDFVDNGNIRLWRVDIKGDDMERTLNIGQSCIIRVKPPSETAKEAYADILDTNAGFIDTINYTDEFVPVEMRKLLHPFKFWVNTDFHDLYVKLEELTDSYDSGLRTFETSDGQGKVGPLVISKGTVNRMTREGRETEYDEGGVQYSLSLTSSELQSMYGGGSGAEVLCNVSSACHDLTHPFTFTDNDGERFEYAEKTTVLVFGRIGMMQRDNDKFPKISVMGIYADDRRSRPRISGGNANMSQFD